MNDDSPLATLTVDPMETWLINWMIRELKLDPSSVESDQAFLSYGMDSVQAMTMVGDLEAHLKRRLPPTLVWDYPTIDDLVKHISEQIEESDLPAGTIVVA